MTIAEIINKYRNKISHLDLELLVAYSLGKTREFVLTYPEKILTKSQILNLKSQINRRIKHEPIAYIIGHKEFYGLDFTVNNKTLVPRPETELLVELITHNVEQKMQKVTIIDVGTGSGNIITSIAHALDSRLRGNDNIEFYAIDISKEALRVARKNAKKHGLYKKIKFLHGNLLDPLLKNKLKIKKLIIVANLPYLNIGWKNLLKSSETKGLKFEPRIALYAGKDGLDAYRKLAKQIKLLGKYNITVFCEIGHLQVSGMRKIFSFAKNITFLKDLAGKWRVCKIKI